MECEQELSGIGKRRPTSLRARQLPFGRTRVRCIGVNLNKPPMPISRADEEVDLVSLSSRTYVTSSRLRSSSTRTAVSRAWLTFARPSAIEQRYQARIDRVHLARIDHALPPGAPSQHESPPDRPRDDATPPAPRRHTCPHSAQRPATSLRGRNWVRRRPRRHPARSAGLREFRRARLRPPPRQQPPARSGQQGSAPR